MVLLGAWLTGHMMENNSGNDERLSLIAALRVRLLYLERALNNLDQDNIGGTTVQILTGTQDEFINVTMTPRIRRKMVLEAISKAKTDLLFLF